jgi:FAD-linked sulfhydryl oxidase
MVSTGASRRFLILFILAFAFVSVLFLSAHRQPPGQPAPIGAEKSDQDKVNGASLTGHAIAPKLGNATAKYVLHKNRHGGPPPRDSQKQLRTFG